MSLLKLSHSFFSNSLSTFNQARVKSILSCTHALVRGNELSLTAIGRNLTGKAKTKHKIKRVDRLLSNDKLYKELPSFYKAISQRFLVGLSNYVIAVDWSGCCRDDFQLLRASLIFDGRSLPLLNLVVEKADYNNNEIHRKFLKQLNDIVGSAKRTYIVTDGGFKTPWFQLVKSFGWDFVGRARGNIHAKLEAGEWGAIKTLFEGANTIPRSLGKGLLTKTQKTQCEVNFHLFKEKPKGRHKKRGHLLPIYAATEKRCKSLATEPWLLVTTDDNLTSRQIVNIYSKRMQIEQNFRDDKSQRYGFSWRNSMSSGAKRIGILCLLSFIATILLWLIGVESEKRKLHHAFQANSIKHRRVLSFLTLAKSMIIQEPQKLTKRYMKEAVKTFTDAYNNLGLV